MKILAESLTVPRFICDKFFYADEAFGQLSERNKSEIFNICPFTTLTKFLSSVSLLLLLLNLIKSTAEM